MKGLLISSVFIFTLCCVNDTVTGTPCLHIKQCRDRFFKLDEDRNGQIEQSEIEKRKVMKERLQGFDLNNDGNVDFSEYYISNHPKDETLYQYRDEDGWINISSLIRVLDLWMQDARNMEDKVTYKEFFKKLFGGKKHRRHKNHH